MNNSIFLILLLVGTIFGFVLNQVLEFIDFYARKKHGNSVPEVLENFVTEQEIKKTSEYENAKYFLWFPSDIVFFILKLVLVFSGFYAFVFNLICSWTSNVYLTILLFIFFTSIPETILQLPFSLYREFHIEKKFGFSNMNLKMWILDNVKSFVVSLIIAVPLLCIASALICHFNKTWWILFGLVYLIFALGLSYIYPILIAPLFNKFLPLEEGELKSRIENLFTKTGFSTNGIFVMDASKRSNHSNAYFTGFGKNKRIVLFDTLLKQLTSEEVESVLGHELGHCKKHHIVKRMIVSIPLVFISLFVVSILIKNFSLYEAFGFSFVIQENSVLPQLQLVGIFLLGLVFSGYENLASLVSNSFSRKDEFEADAYSKKMCGSEKPLITALIKLNKENLTELLPPKIYCMFNYNHPPLMERIEALEK